MVGCDGGTVHHQHLVDIHSDILSHQVIELAIDDDRPGDQTDRSHELRCHQSFPQQHAAGSDVGVLQQVQGDKAIVGAGLGVIQDRPQLAQVRGKTIGFVFQSYQLIPTLTALENVLLPHELNSEAKDAKAGLARARELLTSVGLGDRMEHYPVQLSGGEQQRVALARAFILRPPIVLADEPTGNLDTTNGAHVLELLLNLNRSEGTTLVLVTHDPVLASYANRRIVLRDGMILSDEMNLNPAEDLPQTTVVGG